MFAKSVALVTGASRGIGRGIALALAEAGHHVVVNYRADQSGADETQALFNAEGYRDVTLVQADVGREDDAQAMVARVEREVGPLDVLINNAAAFGRSHFLEADLAEFDRSFLVNVRGIYVLCQAAARFMAERQKGAIVNLSSILAQTTVPYRTVYCATKGAVESLTKAMALDLAPHGIRVNAVAPGFIDTEALRAGLPAGDYAQRIALYTPLGRLGEPRDIADAVAFLASDKARFITGQILNVDGGITAQEAGPKPE